jgi:hypothetical protein
VLASKSEKRGRYEYSGSLKQEKYNYKAFVDILLENLKVIGVAELKSSSLDCS